MEFTHPFLITFNVTLAIKHIAQQFTKLVVDIF